MVVGTKGGESVCRGGSWLGSGLCMFFCSKTYLASWIHGFNADMFINEPKVVVESDDDPEDEASLAMCSNLLILEIVDNNVAIISSLLRFNWKKTKQRFWITFALVHSLSSKENCSLQCVNPNYVLRVQPKSCFKKWKLIRHFLFLITTIRCASSDHMLSLQSDLKHTVDTELYNWCL